MARKPPGPAAAPAENVDTSRPPAEVEFNPQHIEAETDYATWTYQADRWLVRAYGDPQQKGAVRGHTPTPLEPRRAWDSEQAAHRAKN